LVGNDVRKLMAWVGDRSQASNLRMELLSFKVVERVNR
jgi:hypothetical protein